MIKRDSETYMEITERRTADIVTLSLSGKLDGTTAKTFEEKILTRIDSGDRRFIIDVAELNYVSSAGLRVFVLAAKRLGSTNGKLVLCGFKKTIPYHTLNRILDPVRETFDTAGFFTIFSTYGSHEDAIEGVKRKPKCLAEIRSSASTASSIFLSKAPAPKEREQRRDTWKCS